MEYKDLHLPPTKHSLRVKIMSINQSIERVLADYEADNSTEILQRHHKEIRWEESNEDLLDYYEFKMRDVNAENQLLKFRLMDREKEVKDLQDALAKQIAESNKAIRDVAMNWISCMESTLLDKALLGNEWFPFKLPQFPRAVKGDPDYPESTEPKRGLLFYPKRRLTGTDLDKNMCNYAEAHREMLRWMSEEDFKKLCYED